jgi:hypothetical protein
MPQIEGVRMDEVILKSGRDTLLVAIPFAVCLFVSIFGLDQWIAKPRENSRRSRPVCGVDEHGEPILTDPDGRVVRRRNRRR